MPDLQDTLAAIDAATGCQQCEGPLGDSPSDDFCSQECSAAWSAARTVPLVGYREPSDLPVHIHNQVELSSLETTPFGSPVFAELRRLLNERVSPHLLGAGLVPAAFRERRDVTPTRPTRCTCGEPLSTLRNETVCRDCYARLNRAIPPVREGGWVAHFVAPWNPGSSIVPSRYGDRPPHYLQSPRPIRVSAFIRLDALDPPDDWPRADSYHLESFDPETREAVYRVQNLQRVRYMVPRPAPGVPEPWLGAYAGRWEEIPAYAREGELFGGNAVAKPTTRYEARDDGMFAEVWEVAPRPGYVATERFGQVVPESHLAWRIAGDINGDFTLRRIDRRRTR